MPATDLVVPFLIASAVFAYVPGQGMLCAFAQTMSSSRRVERYTAIEFHLAGFGHIAKETLDVTVLPEMIPALLVITKSIGATYLTWLAVRYLLGPAPLAAVAGPL